MKKGDTEVEGLEKKIHSEYRAPDILYYLEAEKYQELKYRLISSDLCIAFYLDLLHDFCKLWDR